MKPQPRVPALSVLREADFRIIWCVGGLSEIARWMEQLVLGLLIWEVTRSPLQLALVLVFNNAPRPLCSPFAGLLAERFSRRSVLFGAQSLATSTAAVLLLALVWGAVQPWLVYLAVALMGITKALEDPSRRTAILDMVGPQRLVNALSLDGINRTIGKVLGPLVGGALVETLGYAGAFGCIVATHIVNLGLMTQLRIPPSQGAPRGDAIWRSLAVAVRTIQRHPLMLGMLYVTVVMNALAFPARQFIPAIGTEYLGVGAAWVGLLAAAEGMGQLIGAGILANTHNLQTHGRVFVLGSSLVLLMAIGFVWAPLYGLAFACLAIGGCGQAGFSTMQSAIAMLGSPAQMRGRMMGLLSVCIGCSTPLGTLGMGMAAAAFTVPAAITANALLGLLLLWPVARLTPLMQRSAPSPPTEPGD